MYVLSSVTDDGKSGSNENPPTREQRECGVTVGYKSGSKGKRASTQQNESQTPDFIEDKHKRHMLYDSIMYTDISQGQVA